MSDLTKMTQLMDFTKAWADIDLWVAKKEIALEKYMKKRDAKQAHLDREQEILDIIARLKDQTFAYLKSVDLERHEAVMAKVNAEMKCMLIYKDYEKEFTKHIKQDLCQEKD